MLDQLSHHSVAWCMCQIIGYYTNWPVVVGHSSQDLMPCHAPLGRSLQATGYTGPQLAGLVAYQGNLESPHDPRKLLPNVIGILHGPLVHKILVAPRCVGSS